MNKHKVEVATFASQNESLFKGRSKTSLVNDRKCRTVSHMNTASVQEYLRTKTSCDFNKNSSKLAQYAEDLLGDHIKKSFQDLKNSSTDAKNQQPGNN